MRCVSRVLSGRLLLAAGLALALTSLPAAGADLEKCRWLESGHGKLVTFGKRSSGGISAELTGMLSRPDGAGPHPAVILLHRYFGVEAPHCYASELERYGSWGFVTLLIDSNSLPPSMRGGAPDTATGYDFEDQASDAIAGLRYLRTLAFVDAERIALVGHAYGGSAALRAALRTSPESSPAGAASFAAVVAWHAYCPESPHGFTAPVLILMGGRDPHQPLAACRALTQLPEPGPPVRLRVFDDAWHNFDVDWLGKYDATATEASYRGIRGFFDRHFPAR